MAAAVVLHIGSNLGYRYINLELCRTMIDIGIGTINSMSKIYVTSPWGDVKQLDFLNQALIVESTLGPSQILSTIHGIEERMGRKREVHWGPRIIDIDIIFYNREIIKNPSLIIPHSELTNRNFVLQPLLDICPDYIHPELKLSVSELAERCLDKGKVREYINDKTDTI